MRTIVEHCAVIATMDDAGTEIADGSIVIEDGVITWVGAGPPPATGEPDERVDGRGAVALPGLVNTHHHLCQTLTKAWAQEGDIFSWLQELYPVWCGIDAEWVRAAASAGLAQLLLSGCTMSTDHHYAFPAGSAGLIEAEIEAAAALGIRFHPNRGSMDLGTHNGGLPPRELCEDRDHVLAETEALASKYHDPGPGSLLRIAVGPCYPLTNTPELMRESAELARRHGLLLHTHLAEGRDEESFMLEKFGLRPLDLLDSYGFLGDDAWLAHCVQLSDADIGLLARTNTGVATCPSSNLRLGSGIAPVRTMLDRGVRVGLGVDGAASNDSGNLMAEARQLLLTQRAGGVDRALTAREALRVATRGGAEVLGRGAELGSLEAGKRGDVALFSMETLEMAGAEADPVAGLLFGGSQRATDVLVEGRPVVRNGALVKVDEGAIVREARRIGTRLARAD
ncbi:8-oxoguanine deaminase [Amycolatopsis jejuensis]|uniref:8-oxoguanine deaminase n=1 Tax=Amycolatopsis jejuensis TaxID=330084 RepID=UPI0005272461|nr:8-oxoguanine deaminase [Amycolatopsis jejuensis]